MSLYLGENLISGQATLVGESRNIGQIIPSIIPLTDAGLHLLDGALIQGDGIYSAFVTHMAGLVTDYPNLFCTEADWQTAVTDYGACDKYVYDSVNNTVRIPKRNSEHGDLIQSYQSGYNWYRIYSDGWCEQGGNYQTETDGVITVNLLKSFTNSSYNLLKTYGMSANSLSANTATAQLYCTWNKTTSSFTTWGKQNGAFNEFSWRASGYIDTPNLQYSPIYEYIVIANSTKTDIEVDIDEVVTDLNGKADVDLVNVNNSGTSRGAGWAMPSSTYIDLTLGASGTNYTAPANGYYAIRMTSTGPQFISMFNNNNGAQSYQVFPGSGWEAGTHIEAKKGQVISIAYNCPTKNMFRFIYAVGSESEA